MGLGRILFVSTCAAVFLLSATAVSVAQNADPGVRTVVIDAGHGGKDPGCVYGGAKEKDINLAVALLLGDMVGKELPGVRVVYTRDKDVYVDLDRRGKIANDAKADLFISIHVNATDKHVKPPSGALTLIMGRENEGSNLDMAMKENQVISFEDDYTTKYKDYLSGSSEMFIIYSLAQYVNIEQSIVFADMFQNNVKRNTPLPDKGIRRQKLLVLWYTTMPGVLVELGFLNNDTDRKVLTSAKGQRQMATAIFDALKEYKQRVESKAATGFADGGQLPAPANERPVVREAVPAVRETPARQTEAAAVTGAAGVVYRVQILSSSKKIAAKSSELKSYRGKAHERHEGGRYRYYVGECRTYAEVLELQADVRKTFRDAFAVAFRDGKQITVPEARKLTDR